MSDPQKTKETLIEELRVLRSRIAEFERREAEFRRAEHRCTTAEQMGQFGHWERDFVKNKATWSLGCYSICGVEPGEFEPSYEKFLRLIHPSDRGLFENAVKAALTDGKAFDIEYRVVRPDGTERFVHSVAEVHLDPGGRPVRLVGTVHDITERKRAEDALQAARDELEKRVEERTRAISRANALLERQVAERGQVEKALRESEEKWRSLVENAPDIILTVDPEGTILFLNRTVPPFTPKEAIGTSVYDHVLPEYQATLRTALERVLETGEPHSYEIAGTGPGGRISWYQSRVGPIKDGGRVVALNLIAMDVTDRKRAEDALRESERRYKALFQGAAEGILVADVETKRFIYANKALCRMLGYTEQEVKQLGVSDIHPKEELEHVFSEFEKQARGEKTLSAGIACLRKDRTIMYADINTACVVVDGRNCNVGFFTDVTERKKAEEELFEAEARYRTLVEQIPAVTYIAALDRASTTKYVSPQIETLIGFSAEEYGRDPDIWRKRLHSEDRERVMAELERTHKHGEPFTCEYRMLARDGREVWFRDEAAIVEDSRNRPLFLQGVMFDITERKQAEEALQKARDELGVRVQQRTADLARDGRILMANPALVKMLGYSAFGELAQLSLEKSGFDRDYPRSVFKQRLEKQNKIIGEESVWIKRDGTRLFVCESAVAIKDPDGNVLYYEGTIEDISERKKAEKKLLMYQKQLRSLASELSLAEERLRRRIATDVHDHIGQNLAISKIKLDSLRESVSSEKLGESLSEISEMIAQTIESSRSLTFELSPPVLYELGLEAALEWLVRKTREQHGLSTEFNNDGRAKPLDEDIRVLLFQAVRELLVNVAKHAKAGKVTVSTRRVGDEIRVSVEDDGVGFDASGVRSHGYKAGGFGLFSIKERIGHIGGRLDIESTPASGTRITLIAPINHGSKTNKEKPR
ncbi:MAG: PAS domain-containing sensor histidine kinase [Planctomycetota bacterium]|jgi:PAS domain S-box-containing protein